MIYKTHTISHISKLIFFIHKLRRIIVIRPQKEKYEYHEYRSQGISEHLEFEVFRTSIGLRIFEPANDCRFVETFLSLHPVPISPHIGSKHISTFKHGHSSTENRTNDVSECVLGTHHKIKIFTILLIRQHTFHFGQKIVDFELMLIWPESGFPLFFALLRNPFFGDNIFEFWVQC